MQNTFIKIAEVDCLQNRITSTSYKIKYFPTMYYLPAGKHKKIKYALEYDSTRTVDALSEWVIYFLFEQLRNDKYLSQLKLIQLEKKLSILKTNHQNIIQKTKQDQNLQIQQNEKELMLYHNQTNQININESKHWYNRKEVLSDSQDYLTIFEQLLNLKQFIY